jgi:hypothetical protein
LLATFTARFALSEAFAPSFVVRVNSDFFMGVIAVWPGRPPTVNLNSAPGSSKWLPSLCPSAAVNWLTLLSIRLAVVVAPLYAKDATVAQT